MAYVDLSLMRDPFFEVRIGPPGAQEKDLILLTPEIHALIDQFEYSEVRDGGNNSASTIKLVFYEDLNKSGSVLDLVLDKAGPGLVKFLEPRTVQSSLQEQKALEQAEFEQGKDSLDPLKERSLKKSLQERVKDLKKKQSDNAHTFLLQERNTIQVTWGYRTGSSNSNLQPRTVRGEILQITHKASESDIPTTEVQAVDFGSGEMSKLYPVEGQSFTRKIIKGLLGSYGLKDTSKRSDTAPARIDDIVRAITLGGIILNSRPNIDLTKEELKLDIQDETSSRTWAKGTNLHGFLRELAEKIHAHYFVSSEVVNGKIVIVLNLVSRRKFEGTNKFRFIWKGGSKGINSDQESSISYHTVLNYNLQLYPAGGEGATSSGICSESKKMVGHVTNTSIQFGQRHSEQLKFLNIPKPNTSLSPKVVDPKQQQAANSIGVSTYNASCSPEQHIAEADRIAGRMDKSLRLEFSTIGIPQLSPGVIEMDNIGIRYSGLYYLLSVVHKISADDGYICTCVGESNSVATGGTSADGPSVRNNLAEKRRLRFRGEDFLSLANLEKVPVEE